MTFADPYHIDDTLYFKDKRGHCDTIIIKSIGKDQNDGAGLKNKVPPFNRIWVTAAHLQSDYWRGTTKSTTGNREVTFQNIIMLEKLPKTNETRIAIEFRNFQYNNSLKKVGKPETTPLALGEKTLNSYYVLVNQKMGSVHRLYQHIVGLLDNRRRTYRL